ncbi:MAG: hypothetical protein KKD64_04565 [Alphaproteobacteria bacterium]|nr:hypothetical protein [Alphaproteobacteria bacterium]MBU0792977.1 hypothetical protein [Alphaproteobacteria bacterium]MBU0875157.1 hypothetical protein [Alphaproteobacteria bacterium]MBU1768906.1 hypothetical protein [Alphaproteobacteria bacterium]
MSRIDLAAVWDDAKAMGMANRDLLGAIAGMFMLLPALVAEQLVTQPEALGENPTNDMVLARLAQYAELNWPVLMVFAVVSSFGVLAMHALLLRAERLTVKESLHAALLILPGYFLANLLQGLGVMSGMLLFLIPGFYLIGRLALIAPVAAAEKLTNPLTILQRSAVLTHGNGWRVFGVIALIFVTMFTLGIVLTSVIGVIAELLLPPDIADLMIALVSSVVETARGVLVVLVCAALYRVTAGAAKSGATASSR